MRTALYLTPLLIWLAACGTDADGDGVTAGTDCDDADLTVNPNMPEICDGKDNNCDGTVDEGVLTTFWADADGDGWGDPEAATEACVLPADHAVRADDCDDSDGTIHPGAREDDCDDPTDYNCDGSVGYDDVDEDGYAACVDCNDGEPDDHPGADERCDGDDNDCDGLTDEDDAVDAEAWYRDADADAYGDPAWSHTSCAPPAGYVADDTDCDDLNPASHPTADEICDGRDNDCDDTIDEDAIDGVSFYADSDRDGFGDPRSPTTACEAPDTYVADNTDCDDGDVNVHPGAPEQCNEEDDDCDGDVDEDGATDAKTWYLDYDGDGYGGTTITYDACLAPRGYVSDATDCDDLDDATYPSAEEVCDGADNDCDRAIDEGPPDDALTWYRDADSDGAGDPDSSLAACEAPAGYVANDLDCDDTDSSRYDGCFALEGVVLETCGATGRNGPTQSACDAEYSGTDLEGLVSVTGGVQTLTVPESGVYGITAVGAAGFSPTSSYKGGKGAQVYGEFALKRGDTLQIVVGQVGSGTGTTGNGGGGGGTFVATGAGTAMLVAGGGGGTRADARANGCDAEVGQYGSGASGYNDTRTSGTCVAKTTGLGSGGGVSASSYGSGGAGFTGDGTGDSSWGVAAKSFTNGAVGGQTTTSCGSVTGDGGFGGGGSGGGCWGGGGGGGYSGGDGGFIAGGGGSYLSGSNQASTAAVSTGDGSVTIEKL